MYINICVCDDCGTELKNNSEHYHIDFASSHFIDGADDTDYNTVRVDLCEYCCKNAVKSLNNIANKTLDNKMKNCIKVKLCFDSQFCGKIEKVVEVNYANADIQKLFEKELGVAYDKNCWFEIVE